MNFKEWITKEFFVPGTHYNRPQDITNIGLGVRSKYIGPDETGVGHGEDTKIANFGMDSEKKKKESKFLNRVRRLKGFLQSQRRNNVKP